jgi:hypothetical protein
MESKDMAEYTDAMLTYCNSFTDKKCKSWDEVTNLLFKMNCDPKYNTMYDMVMIMKYSMFPYQTSVPLKHLEERIPNITFNESTFKEMEMVKNVDYILKPDIRVSFFSYRRIIYTHGCKDLIQILNSYEQLYDTYKKYREDVCVQNKLYTHWAIIQKMSEHPATENVKDRFKNDPLSYIVLKGTKSKLKKKIGKLNNKDEEYGKLVMGITETVHYDGVTEEISLIMNYIHKMYIHPHLEEQFCDPNNLDCKKITESMYVLKVINTLINIDSKSKDMNIDVVIGYINEAREAISKGQVIYVSPKNTKLKKLKPSDIKPELIFDMKFFKKTGILDVNDTLKIQNDEFKMKYENEEELEEKAEEKVEEKPKKATKKATKKDKKEDPPAEEKPKKGKKEDPPAEEKPKKEAKKEAKKVHKKEEVHKKVVQQVYSDVDSDVESGEEQEDENQEIDAADDYGTDDE